jgi:hypothetical protein
VLRPEFAQNFFAVVALSSFDSWSVALDNTGAMTLLGRPWWPSFE